MSLLFAKMHGLGNDFMVLDLVTQQWEPSIAQVRAWADRKTGVGFDQLLLIEPPTVPEADFRYRIFNADGDEVEQCGNGARCAARYIVHRGLSPKPELLMETLGGPITTRLIDGEQVEVDMGTPRLRPEDVPFDPTATPGAASVVGLDHTYEMEVLGELRQFIPLSMGNPHCVMFVDSVAEAPVESLGPALVSHAIFPEGANIGFCQVVDRGFLRLRVYERGVGETRACGTGACAAVVAARLLRKVGSRVKVSLPGGKVRINWQGDGSTVKLTGPATLVFEGQIQL